MAKIFSDLSPEPPEGAADPPAAAAALLAYCFASMLVMTVAISSWLEAGKDDPVSYWLTLAHLSRIASGVTVSTSN